MKYFHWSIIFEGGWSVLNLKPLLLCRPGTGSYCPSSVSFKLLLPLVSSFLGSGSGSPRSLLFLFVFCQPHVYLEVCISSYLFLPGSWMLKRISYKSENFVQKPPKIWFLGLNFDSVWSCRSWAYWWVCRMRNWTAFVVSALFLLLSLWPWACSQTPRGWKPKPWEKWEQTANYYSLVTVILVYI